MHFQLSGHLLAAYGYGAPEFDSGIYTHQSDVYSFGVVMLELLTGRKSYDKWECMTKPLVISFQVLPSYISCIMEHLGQDTRSRRAVFSEMGNTPTSWHWCLIKDGWSFSQWRLPSQITVKLCRHCFSMCSGKLISLSLNLCRLAC